jgi:hypothetical protein
MKDMKRMTDMKKTFMSVFMSFTPFMTFPIRTALGRPR